MPIDRRLPIERRSTHSEIGIRKSEIEMDPLITWAIILAILAVVIFVAEIFLPSGGLLGIAAVACVAASVVLCFIINRWLGAGVSIALLILAPFLWMAGISLWQRSPVGKRLTLTTTVGELPAPHVLVGATGVTITELRPMGECEVGEARIESQSEMGVVIPAGRKVKVLSIASGVATVREIKDTQTIA